MTIQSLALINSEKSLELYLKDISQVVFLSREEELALANAWVEKQDIQAAQKLVVSHLPLVAKTAFSFKNYGIPVADLISEGTIGLMKAVENFRPELGYKLATYAKWWIKAYITEYIVQKYSMVKYGTLAARKKLFFSLNKIKHKLGITSRHINKEEALLISHNVEDVTPENVQAVNAMVNNSAVSIDKNYGEDESNTSMIDFLAKNVANPEEEFFIQEEHTNKKHIVQQALSSLTAKELYIIKKRYFSQEDKNVSLASIAKELNLSRERIRQIEKQALTKMKKYLHNT